jgi:hypothetical protein
MVWGADLISRHLDTVGDGTGVKEAIGDYSATPTVFRIENTNPVLDMVLNSFQLYLQSDGKFLPNKYGGVPGLINGIRFVVMRDGDIITDLTNGEPLVHTCCLARLFSRVEFSVGAEATGGGPGKPDWVAATWDFGRHGVPLVLGHEDSLEAHLNDDFSGLDVHRFTVFGYWANAMWFD